MLRICWPCDSIVQTVSGLAIGGQSQTNSMIKSPHQFKSHPLANVLLDKVDKELEKRGHRYARYADDCNVYMRSLKAGEWVLRLLRDLYEKLHLRVNVWKTEVGPVFGRKFLGYSLRGWPDALVGVAREQPIMATPYADREHSV